MSQIGRGVQYVHCVMHKCIMVKVGGKRNTCKACKKHVNFQKQRKFVKVGGKNNFRETGGKCTAENCENFPQSLIFSENRREIDKTLGAPAYRRDRFVGRDLL